MEVDEQKIRYLLVEHSIKGLGLIGAGESMIQVGPSAPGALSSFVKELAKARKLKIDRLFLTINRRDTVVHQLSLGSVSKTDLEQIIVAEIEKIPSFTDNEFDYIYQQHETKNRNKVILGAMTDELVQYLLKEVKQTGIPCQELELAPLNLSGLLGSADFKQGPQAVIILSENLTHLVIFEDRQIRYIYTTTIGEEIWEDKFATKSWGEELKRTLKSYALDTKQTVGKHWLVWDRDKSPEFDKYLHHDLNLEAEPLNILQEWFKENINPAYTLAAIPLIYKVNKIKPVFSLTHFLRGSQAHNYKRLAIISILAAILITGAVLGFIIDRFNTIEHQALRDQKDVQSQMADVQRESTDILKERDNYLSMRKQLLFQATYVQLLKKLSWSRALSVVANEMPKELALTSFKVDEEGQVTFTGEAFRMESIAKLLRTIEISSILERGQFSYLTQEEIEKKKVFSFGILADIKTGGHS
jgi:uncharacterized membrane-anchored protein YhcB (DUF1043 family)